MTLSKDGFEICQGFYCLLDGKDVGGKYLIKRIKCSSFCIRNSRVLWVALCM